MSRIGRAPITIPDGVSVCLKNKIFEVKGKNGLLTREIPYGISLEINDKSIQVTRNSESKKDKSLHGLIRVLINNMIIGVTVGFKKHLLIEGVGYKAVLEGKNKLNLALGYSHPINYTPPENIILEVIKNNEIVVKGNNKELVGQVAVKIRSFRKPEPYKGKGIRYLGEIIRRKVGKAASGASGSK